MVQISGLENMVQISGLENMVQISGLENMVQISGLENMVQISGFELSVVKLMQCYRYFSKTNNNRFQIMGHLRFFTCF